jgi:hypothetical protein
MALAAPSLRALGRTCAHAFAKESATCSRHPVARVLSASWPSPSRATLHTARGLCSNGLLTPTLAVRPFSTTTAIPPPFSPSPSPSPSPDPVVIRPGDTLVAIPRGGVSVSFSRSSGAGGQNVNKVNTKAEVRFRVQGEGAVRWLDAAVAARLVDLYPGYVNADGDFYVSAQEHRTQERNLDECLSKVVKMVRRAATVPKVRVLRTALSELTKEGRREDKRHRSVVKERRKGPSGAGDDE